VALPALFRYQPGSPSPLFAGNLACPISGLYGAQGMCGQLADQTNTQTPEGMGVVLFNSELI
jgi:hypothetical protein